MRFTELARAHQTFCGLTAAGEVHCWGMDGEPRLVADGVRLTTLEGSAHRACGVTAQGEIRCWEYDGRGHPAPPARAPAPPPLP